MRFAGFALFLVCAWWPVLGAAQDAAETERIADTMVRLCVGGGHTEATSGAGSGGADLSLRSLDVTGNVKGEFKINKSSAEGLVNGLDNALSQVAATGRDASTKEAGFNGSDGDSTGRCGCRKGCKRVNDHD
jgi:hypothetical protein